MPNNIVKRDVKYINRDFADFRESLINLTKQYFPNTYQDFNETSPGMLMLEMSAYVGDVLSFYADTQLRESLLATTEEKINLYNLSQVNGYKVKTLTPASVDLDIYQLVPSLGAGSQAKPDMRYAQIIDKDMVISEGTGILFRTIESIDFRASSSLSPTDVSVYSVTNDGNIEYYLLKKQVRAISGEIVTRNFEFGNPKVYDKIVLPEENVLEIVDMYDDDANKWYEVPFLAQDLVETDIQNIPVNNPYLAKYRSSVPYLLCYKQTEHRFVTRLRRDDKTEIQFGAGMSSEADEEIVPNPFNVGIGLNYFERTADLSIDPKNFLYTRTYGTAPGNTTLTIRYTIGGGLAANVPANTLTTIETINYQPNVDTLDNTLLTTVRDSVAVNNPQPAWGGGNVREIDRVRLEAMAHFNAQNRAVTKEDYILRCYSLPAKYGQIAKAYIVQDEQLSTHAISEKIPNPFALNLYLLGYNNTKQFVPLNIAAKENLRNYLKGYRLLTDAINIKDAFIVNIGIDAEIITRPNYNSNEVLLKCVNKLIDLFENDRREINQPIIINNIYTELDRVEGVQTVTDIKIINLYDLDSGYSGNVYDLELATRMGIVFPSIDPCVFEVRFPKKDIRVRVIDL